MLAALILCAALAGPAAPEAAAWRFERAASSAQFSVRFLGLLPLTGEFRQWQVHFEPLPGSAEVRVRAELQTASLDLDSARRERWAKSEDFLDARRHPQIVFRSEPVSFDALAAGGSLAGTLSLHGATQPVQLAVAARECANAAQPCLVRVRTSIRRSDYGLGGYHGLLAERVLLRLDVAAWPPGH